MDMDQSSPFRGMLTIEPLVRKDGYDAGIHEKGGMGTGE